MQRRYIHRLHMQSRRKQVYHTQAKQAEEPSLSELIQQVKSQQEKEKEKYEKE